MFDFRSIGDALAGAFVLVVMAAAVVVFLERC